MRAEITELYPRTFRPPFLNLRWSAVFAGLAVGVAANLVLLLIGAAVGLAVFNAGGKADEEGLVLAVSVWDTLCMIIAAVLGGYVAARASGMRRTPDGILHGVLAWCAAMLIVMLLATSAAGSLFAGTVSGFLNHPAATVPARPLDGAEREAIVQDLQSRFGLSRDQADSIASEIGVMSNQERAPEANDAMQTLRTATLVGGWVSAAVLLSLLGAVGGGAMGSRSSRRSTRLPARGAVTEESPSEVAPPPYSPPY
jgi:hypothetical protein